MVFCVIIFEEYPHSLEVQPSLQPCNIYACTKYTFLKYGENVFLSTSTVCENGRDAIRFMVCMIMTTMTMMLMLMMLGRLLCMTMRLHFAGKPTKCWCMCVKKKYFSLSSRRRYEDQCIQYCQREYIFSLVLHKLHIYVVSLAKYLTPKYMLLLSTQGHLGGFGVEIHFKAYTLYFPVMIKKCKLNKTTLLPAQTHKQLQKNVVCGWWFFCIMCI